MSRQFFGVEKGLATYAENGTLLFQMLSGTATPDGLLDQATAPIGSLYVRSGVGEIYQKIANIGNASDWELNGSSSVEIGTWRPENVLALTDEVQGAGTRDMIANPFTDDEGTPIPFSEYAIDKYVITGAATAPVLLRISAVASPNVTYVAAANPLVEQDAFIVRHYLPDTPATQEGQAIVVFNGSEMVKVGDINWNFADGINLSATYAAQNGSITSADTVNSAIEKLDGNQQDIQAASGLTQGDVNYGTFTGQSLADAQTSKQLFQRIETLLEQMRGVKVNGITTATAVDTVPVASVKACKWLVDVELASDVTRRKAFEVYGLNNGTLADDTVYAKLSLGSNFNVSLNVDVSGGNMRLVAASSTPGINVTARRIEVVKSIL